MKVEQKEFDVALSFAGEDRDYVENVASNLRKMGIKVFYDKYELVSLWGKDLYDYLQDLYYNKARFTVIFISKHYADKVWTNHERKSAQARSFMSNIEYILPVRFDQTEIPGILPTAGYINALEYSPEQLSNLIKKKIGRIRRYEFFPEDPDLLYKKLRAKSKKYKYGIKRLAENIFQDLKLMTMDEINLLFETINNSCPSDFPNNYHLSIELLSRIIGKTVEEIQAMYSRLECLGIASNARKLKLGEDQICKESIIIEVSFINRWAVLPQIINATFIVHAIKEILEEYYCPECRKRAFIDLDFSILSTLTGFPEEEAIS